MHRLRTIIAGSRGATLDQTRTAIYHAGWLPSVVLCGMARGADMHGHAVAVGYGWPVEEYPANWDKNPRTAGHIRNIEMAAKAEALIAVWDGQSPGTRHMIQTARDRGLRIYVWRTDLCMGSRYNEEKLVP